MPKTTELLQREVELMSESSTVCKESFERIWTVGGDKKELAKLIIDAKPIVYTNTLDFIRESASENKGSWCYAMEVVQEIIKLLYDYRWLHTHSV
jgi:hypothetical protein